MIRRKSIVYLILYLTLALSISLLGALSNLEAQTEQPPSQEEIIIEAQTLLMAGKPIDARAKLQKALKLYPDDYRPHMMLGAYYLSEVGHFRLANRYLLKAEQLFLEQHPISTRASGAEPLAWQNHSKLLYLLAESRLNLDNYQGSLQTIEEYEKHYWDSWLPGTKAWVLWKLGRTEEAVNAAKAGLIQGASPGKTYNILGILYSSIKKRSLAIEAYKNAIKTEKLLGSFGMVATPLNNAGEVYREMFEDQQAEAAWVKALSLPDGCEHILPSLNLAITYQESLRLFKAERVLSDFEACFAANSEKEDGEHKALLSLARGRIAFREGKINLAYKTLEDTASSTQWFGRIGTNENDFKVASNASLVTLYRAKANYLKILASKSLSQTFKNKLESIHLKIKAYFIARKVRQMGLEELNDFEDLWIRFTDSMIDYPGLGDSLAGFPLRSFDTRVKRLGKIDDRKDSKNWYKLYLAENHLNKGNYKKAIKLLESSIQEFRKKDRLVKSHAFSKLITAKKSQLYFWQTEPEEINKLSIELFNLLPSQLPYHGISLPVNFKIASNSKSSKKKLSKVNKKLLKGAFKETGAEASFEIISSSGDKDGETINLQFIDKSSNQPLVSLTKKISSFEEEAELINDFIFKVFSHKEDYDGEPLPDLEILQED